MTGDHSTPPEPSPASTVPDSALFGRRRLLQVGGLAAAAAGLTACINGKAATSQATTTTQTTIGSTRDTTTLRTASSIEALIVEAYQRVIDSGLVTTPDLADTLKLFQAQHKQHAQFFEAETERLGGTAFSDPNPSLADALAARLAGLKSEHDAVQLAYDLEKEAAATYQADVGNVDDPTINAALMSVGGIEARHVAVFAPTVGQQQVSGAFAGTTGAVAPGTGL